MPPLGTINVHGSLLPQYRGAAPINWAVINGEKFTGVTTFKLQQEIDTGNILLSEKIAIEEDDNAGTVHDKLKEVGAALLVKTILLVADDKLVEIPQQKSAEEIKHAPKLFTETGNIDWNKNVEEIYNLIRGLSPYPVAYTKLHSKVLKIFAGEKLLDKSDISPGTFKTDGKNFLQFAGANGYINVTTIQLEGKKKMEIKEFLRGYRFPKQ